MSAGSNFDGQFRTTFYRKRCEYEEMNDGKNEKQMTFIQVMHTRSTCRGSVRILCHTLSSDFLTYLLS